MSIKFSVTADILWNFKGDTDPDYLYCRKHATFKHSDACEFILHIGPDTCDGDDTPYWADVVAEMKQFGCTPGFIRAYEDAKEAGAMRVIFFH